MRRIVASGTGLTRSPQMPSSGILPCPPNSKALPDDMPSVRGDISLHGGGRTAELLSWHEQPWVLVPPRPFPAIIAATEIKVLVSTPYEMKSGVEVDAAGQTWALVSCPCHR